MLGFWRTHADYQSHVSTALTRIAKLAPSFVLEYETEISMLHILNLDLLKPIIEPLYSITGRPAINQPEIFRSFVLMIRLGYPLAQWLSKLANNLVLQIICGFSGSSIPGVASYYDFINRLIKLDEKPRLKRRKRKPGKKYGRGKKLPPKHPGAVQRLVDEILAGRRFNSRPERFLQEVFANVSVRPSMDLGLIPNCVPISGDGTCIRTGASRYGVKACECTDYHCDCPRRFADPNATWGWDSHNELWFYGYTGYFISTYNKADKIDLPLYLRLVDAKRHDSISAVVALAEFRDLYPDLIIVSFISDSASNNYATYQLLDAWDINAVIALNSTNKGNRKYPAASVDVDGVPICPGGNKMVYDGFCGKNRCRIKWRCPRVCNKRYDNCVNCSPSDYGRVIYTKPAWDLRLFTRIPRSGKRWKELMKKRTAAERVNNRILNHYGLESSHVRGKKRISFFATVAAINIHLGAQLAKLKSTGKFVFDCVLNLVKAA